MKLASWLGAMTGAALLLHAGQVAIASTLDISLDHYRLPNGLEVILHVDHGAPIVHIEVWYKVGSKDETQGRTGFAHLFEHMMFQGTKHIPEDAFLKTLADAGASARNGTTDTDRTAYYETLPASQLELGLWLESSRMGFSLDRPNLDVSFANQREVVKNERRQTVENVPLGAADRLELEALYPVGHPYRHEVVGSMDDLDAAGVADLKDFFARYYAPNNAVMFVGGDLDAVRAKQLIAKYFGPISPAPTVQHPPAPSIPAPLGERRILMEAKIQLPRGRMAWTTVPVFAPGDAEMDLLASILGGDKSSRLYQRLVEQLGIAQSVSADHVSRGLGGTFEIAYVAMRGHTPGEIERVIDEELDRLRSQPPSPEEVARARNQIKTDLVRGLEPLAGLASRLLYYDLFAEDPGYLRRDLGRYDRATPLSLAAWTKRLLPTQARVVIDAEPYRHAPIMGRVVSPVPWSQPQNLPAQPIADKAHPATPISRTTPDADFRHQRPPAGAERAFKVPAVKRFRLHNGLPVILVESHKLPLIDIDLFVKSGGAANPPDQPGLAGLVADLLDEGTQQRTAEQIAHQISQLGATLSTHVSWDATTVSLSTLTDNFDRALPIWSDVLLHPSFPEQERRRDVDNWISTLSLRKDYPPMVADQAFARALWGDRHPFAWPQGGPPAALRKLRHEDLRRFHDTYYVPNNAILTVAGDITEREVRARLESLWADWRPRKIVRGTSPAVATPPKTPIILIDKPGAPQSSIRIGLVAIDRKSPDYYAAMVTNQLLGGTLGRLATNLRETKGWTYDVQSTLDARREVGPWTIAGEFASIHTAEAVVEILKELDRLRSQEVPEAELADTKEELVGAFPARFATADLTAEEMATLAIYDLPHRALDDFTRKIEAVDRRQVQRTAIKYLRPERLLIVIVGDRASNEAALHRIAAVEARDLDGKRVTSAARRHPAPPAKTGLHG